MWSVGDGVPQRAVPGIAARGRLRLRPGVGLHHRSGRQLNLIGNVTGLDEAEPLAGLGGDVDRVGEFGLLPLITFLLSTLSNGGYIFKVNFNILPFLQIFH